MLYRIKQKTRKRQEYDQTDTLLMVLQLAWIGCGSQGTRVGFEPVYNIIETCSIVFGNIGVCSLKMQK